MPRTEPSHAKPVAGGASAMPLHRRGAGGRVHVYDPVDAPWQAVGRDGVLQKIIRRDDELGHFLGLIAMEPMTRTGLHQHQAVATSFFLEGGLTDHEGSVGLHQAGINLRGATHDAIAYARTLFVARLQGPVLQAPDEVAHGLHAGARMGRFEPPDPSVPADITVDVDALPQRATGCAGLLRQSIFDYSPTTDDHRWVQLSIRPRTRIPRLLLTGFTEFWVRGGTLELDGRAAHAGCFVIIEPHTELSLDAPYGARLMAWSEGPAHWVEAAPRGAAELPMRADLFGYR